MSTELANIETGELVQPLYPDDPQELITVATTRANALRTVINSQHLSVKISGREYVTAEGWTTLAAMHGVIPCVIASEKLNDGAWRAIVELRHLTTGRVYGRAYGQCGGPSDGDWATRKEYACESMAATRATAKACRLSFSWIMTLAGFSPTPAEEMDGEATHTRKMVIESPADTAFKAGQAQDVQIRQAVMEERAMEKAVQVAAYEEMRKAGERPPGAAATAPTEPRLTEKQLKLLQWKLGQAQKAEKWLEMKLKIDRLDQLPITRVDEALEIIASA